MKKDIIDHLAVCTDNITKSVAWYKDNFSCDILYQDDSWAMLEFENIKLALVLPEHCLLYTSPSPRDQRGSRMPSSA